MGEFAKFRGEQIKIGTCENMYYLRADQAHLVTAQSGNVDPIRDAEGIRFRFPWPDEDHIAPGEFESYGRALGLFDVKPPDLSKVDHGRVQFSAPGGYLISLPCPEVEEGPGSDHGLKFHRNGWGGAVKISQQKWCKGALVLVCECGGCGAKYRLETLADAQPVIDSLRKRAESDRHAERVRPDLPSDPPAYKAEPKEERIARAGKFYDEIANRIVAGYATKQPTAKASPPRARKSAGAR